MMDRRGTAAVAFAAAMAIAAVALADPPPSTPTVFLTLAGSPQLVVSHAANAKAETFPLAVLPTAGVEVHKLAASVLAITRDGSIQALVPTAVVATLDAAGGAPVLKLAVDFTRLFVPGTYEATILISRVAEPADAAATTGTGAAPAGAAGTGPAAAPVEPQRLSLRLIVPAATLRPLPPIVVERELALFGEARVSQPTITLRETSNLAPLRLSASQDGALVADDRLVGAQIGLAALPPIDPGMASTTTLALGGRFPIGTTRGNLLLTAPELAMPVVVPVEIRTRRAAWLVPLLFILGAAVGFLWRTLLAARRTALATEIATGELRERIVEVIDTQPADWAVELLELKDALDKLDPRVAATQTRAEAALQAALEARAANVATLVQHIQAGLVATRSPWRLPRGLDLVEGATHYSAAYEQLQRRAFGEAIARGQRGATAVGDVLERCRSWASELARFLAPYKAGVPGCPAQARAGVEQTVTAAIHALEAAEAAMTAPAPATAATPATSDRLQAMHAAARAAGELAKALAEALDHARRVLPATLEPAVAAEMMSATTLPSRRSDRPEEAIEDGVAACARLAAIAMSAVRTMYADDVPGPVAAAVTEGKYVEALTPRPVPPRPGDGRGLPVSGRLAAPAQPTADLMPAPARRAAAPVATAVIMPLDTAAPSVARPARTARQLHAALDRVAWLRWSIGAVVTSAAAWALYGDAFQGTGVEAFAVFAAGFLTDLTTDTAIEALLGKLKPPTANLAAASAPGAPG